MRTLPRLLRVVNLDTREVFTLFVKSIDEAYLALPISKSDDIEFEWVMAPAKDGSNETYPIYMLRDIPKTTYFRTVNCGTLNISNSIYVRYEYDRCAKMYYCLSVTDIASERKFKSTQWVITDFTY